MKENLKVCWLSAGVSSFIAGYLAGDVDKYIYIHIDDQHPDSLRFIHDCEEVVGMKVEIIRSTEYSNVEECIRAFNGFRNVRNGFAPCTNWLKKRVRKQWEYEHRDYDITYVWGFDAKETKRANNLIESMPEFHHQFPLIEKQLSKKDVHAICEKIGIKRPYMYDLGYSNNNCVGCVKGGMGYWNKIRVDFPAVFESRAKLERDIGYTMLKDKNGYIYLDELDPNRGNMNQEVIPECGIACQLAYDE